MSKMIYMLEDDPDDRHLTAETLAELGTNYPIKYFSNSTDLFNELERSTLPALILADYNATPDDALTVLERLKKNEPTAGIPVVVLSDNDLERYRQQCYAAGASTCVKKPDTLEETRSMIQLFFRYWTEVASI